MTPLEKLAELRAAVAQMTGLPWTVDPICDRYVRLPNETIRVGDHTPNGAGIVALRENAEALLDIAEAAAQCMTARGALTSMTSRQWRHFNVVSFAKLQATLARFAGTKEEP
jgi:hypothetical protein